MHHEQQSKNHYDVTCGALHDRFFRISQVRLKQLNLTIARLVIKRSEKMYFIYEVKQLPEIKNSDAIAHIRIKEWRKNWVEV